MKVADGQIKLQTDNLKVLEVKAIYGFATKRTFKNETQLRSNIINYL